MKRITMSSIALCIAGGILISVASLFSQYDMLHVNAVEILDSGYCRDTIFDIGDTNLTYTFDTDGVLTISGTGEMNDFRARNGAPWHKYRDDIKKIVIEEGVTSIGNRTLGYCRNCTEVSLPSTMKRVEEFCMYESLQWIDLPEGLEEIGIQAFVGCDLLKTVTIPSTVTSISLGAFERCNSLYEIKVAAGNSHYTDIDGVLYTKDITELVQYPNGKPLTSYTVPSTVVAIGEDAFYDVENLEEILLPDGLITIEKNAFNGCGIRSISIPEGVTVLSRGAFNSCKSLTTVVVPANIVRLDTFAFRNNASLERIAIENPACEFEDSGSTISSNLFVNERYNGTIYGYAGSTAQAYAEKYGYQFDLIENYVSFMLGDVNEDGDVDATDASLILIASARIGAGVESGFASVQKSAADVDGKNGIDATDASLILQYSAAVGAGFDQTLQEFLKNFV